MVHNNKCVTDNPIVSIIYNVKEGCTSFGIQDKEVLGSLVVEIK